jgi:hypothetical protein
MLIAVANGEGYHTSQLFSRLAGSDSRALVECDCPNAVSFGDGCFRRACGGEGLAINR